LRAFVVVLVFKGARRLLFSSSILATNGRIPRIFNITKMVAKRSQRAVLMGNTESLKREIRREMGLSLTTEVRDHGIEFGSADFSLIFLMILAGLARKIGHLHCVW